MSAGRVKQSSVKLPEWIQVREEKGTAAFLKLTLKPGTAASASVTHTRLCGDDVEVMFGCLRIAFCESDDLVFCLKTLHEADTESAI